MGERLFEELEGAQLYEKYRLRYNDIGLENKLLSFMSQSLKQVPYACAVDVGCGTGFLTRTLAPHFRKVMGVDISLAQLQVAREATKEANVEYKIARAEDMSILTDNSAELVATAVSIHYFDIGRFLKEVDRVLIPGGCLAIIQPKSFHLTPDTDNPDIIERFTLLFNEFRRFNRRNLSHEASKILDGDISGIPYSISDRVTWLYESCPYNIPYKRTVTVSRSYKHRNIKREQSSFTLTTKRCGNIEIFSGFADTLGGVGRFRRENPDSEDVPESFKARFLEVLSEISATPEKVKVTLSCPLLCSLYRKPSV